MFFHRHPFISCLALTLLLSGGLLLTSDDVGSIVATLSHIAATAALVAALLDSGRAGELLLITEAVAAGDILNLLIGEVRQLLAGAHVAHVLDETLGEDEIDLLETALLGLWVQEVDDGDEARVHGSEEDVSAVVDVGNHDRRNHNDEEVAGPVDGGRDSVGTGTSTDGVDLGWVKPWQRKPGSTEECDVGEETHSGTLRSGDGFGDQTGKHENHA